MIKLDKDDFHVVTYGGSRNSRMVMLFGTKSGVKYYFHRHGSSSSGPYGTKRPYWKTYPIKESLVQLEFRGQIRKDSLKKYFEENLTRSRLLQADVFRQIFSKKSKFE